MTYLLDAGPLVAYLFDRPTAVSLIGPWIEQGEVAASMVACAEAIEHIQNQPREARHMAALAALLRRVPTVKFDLAVAVRYAALRRALRPPHGPGLIGDMDTLIAASALAYNLTVVSPDAHFSLVPGLQLLPVPRKFT